ncbi:MAG: hypothetical protein JSV24_11535, partial [Bacteroidales bacterium]
MYRIHIELSRSVYRAVTYLCYFLFGRHRKGYGIHSPLVFEFITSVLRDRQHYVAYTEIESVRKGLRKSNRLIRSVDYGAGNIRYQIGERKISDIAKTSATRIKYGKLLFRMVKYFKPLKIVELGTSLGI